MQRRAEALDLRTCPACGEAVSRELFRVERVPVNSVRLHRTAADARAVPRGAIALGACVGCGFVRNLRFDPSLVDYSPGYESTQAYSETFAGFQDALARALVQRHGLRGRRIAEIGCGRGELLSLLCRLGGNSGVGYDPSLDPRAPAPGPTVRLVPRRFEDAAPAPADFHLCVMTLEHVDAPDRLVAAIAAAGRRAGAGRGYFQVPDARRIFAEAAFWDVYYEHCNYFSEASLGRLLARQGIAVDRIERGFDDQYLMADVRFDRAGAAPADADDVPADWGGRIARSIAAWRTWVGAMAAAGRSVALWGGGSKAVAFLSAIGEAPAIRAIVDVNPRKDGTFLAGAGLPVFGPHRLADLHVDHVIAMNPIYRGEIMRDLAAAGVPAALTTVDLDPPASPIDG
ncbi:MAG: class I SAM-dependent methyltransferase [Alphaproteobacteria bacterium]